MARRRGPMEKRLDEMRRARADRRLFLHLAEIHHLQRDDRELLLALADHHRLVRSSEIFVRPSLLHESPDRARWSDHDLQRLDETLFGSSAEGGDGG
ncbi:MAG: hypothetical protein ACE5GW_02220 [Planctomycetota bacterium]